MRSLLLFFPVIAWAQAPTDPPVTPEEPLPPCVCSFVGTVWKKPGGVLTVPQKTVVYENGRAIAEVLGSDRAAHLFAGAKMERAIREYVRIRATGYTAKPEEYGTETRLMREIVTELEALRK
jgi:hypothetical protein